mgnify:CR=1 FL=1
MGTCDNLLLSQSVRKLVRDWNLDFDQVEEPHNGYRNRLENSLEIETTCRGIWEFLDYHRNRLENSLEIETIPRIV